MIGVWISPRNEPYLHYNKPEYYYIQRELSEYNHEREGVLQSGVHVFQMRSLQIYTQACLQGLDVYYK
jgi:hypothetical protein